MRSFTKLLLQIEMARIVKIRNNGAQVLPQTVMDAVLDSSMQNSLTDILAEKVGKKEDARMEGLITMTKGIESDEYNVGISGFKMGKLASGESYVQTDVLKVLKRSEVASLEILKAYAVGGTLIVSATSATIDEWNGERAYFKASDGANEISNDWKEGDFVFCATYNGNRQRTYWYEVLEVGTAEDGRHYVCFFAEDEAPEAGDVIVQFGSASDTSRQSAIIISAVGVGAPYIKQLHNISDREITDENITTILSAKGNVIRGQEILLSTNAGDESVGEFMDGCAAIGIDAKTGTITLDAKKTIVSGDLGIQTVTCYYANGKPKSSYNGNGDGTMVYYYENGSKLREEAFKYDDEGNVIDLVTINYKRDGSISWVLDENGIKTTLQDYWVGLGVLHYCDSEDVMKALCKEHLQDALQYMKSSEFSRFVCDSSSKNAAYNGKVAMGKKSSQVPTTDMLYSGVLVYDLRIVSQSKLGIITYEVTYEVVSAALGQLSVTNTYQFTSI